MAANLFAQFAQPVRSVNDYLDQYDAQDARRAAMEGQRQQNAIQAMAMRRQMEADATAAEDRNALARLAQGWNAQTPMEDRIASLRNSGRAGLLTQADALEKGWLDRRNTESTIGKNTAEAKAKESETARKAREAAATQIAALNSPEEALALLKTKIDGKEVPPELGPAFESLIRTDPKWQIKLALAVGDPQKLVETLKPHIQTNNIGGSTVTQAIDPLTGKPTVTGTIKNTQSPDNAATNARLAADAAASRAQAERIAAQAVTYQQDADGNFVALPTKIKPGDAVRATPVMAPGGVKPLAGGGKSATVEERNAAGYASRMVEATKLLDKFEEKGAPTAGTAAAGAIPLIGGVAQRAVSTADQQRYRQAQEDWVRAKLRKESGAAIGKDEMEREIAAYFPQVLDTPEVIAQKKQARLVANEAMNKSAGKAAYKSEVNDGLSAAEQAELEQLRKQLGRK